MQGHKIPMWAWKAGFDWNWFRDDEINSIGGTRGMARLWIADKGKESPCRYTLLNSVIDTDETKTFLRTDDAADVIAFLADPPAEWTAWEVANEIMHDATDLGGKGFALAEIKCFEDLHNHLDPNEYGSSARQAADGTPGAPGWHPDETLDCAYWNDVHERVDQWIRNGFCFARMRAEQRYAKAKKLLAEAVEAGMVYGAAVQTLQDEMRVAFSDNLLVISEADIEYGTTFDQLCDAVGVEVSK
jgi:hypothetical protein